MPPSFKIRVTWSVILGFPNPSGENQSHMVTRKFRNLTGVQRLISFDIEMGTAAAGEYLSHRIVVIRDM
jgi:hypothetical protein